MKLALMVGAPDMAAQGGYVRTPTGSFADTFAYAARLGFDGAEVLSGGRLTGDIYALRQAVSQTKVQVAGFNSGRLFFDHGLVLLCGDSRHCALTRDAIYDLIRLAASFDGHINIGMFRGLPTTPDLAPSVAELVIRMRQLADYAARLKVQLLIEPANKKEFPFISSTQEGLDLVETIDRPNVGLMLDTFHMAVEEEDMCASIRRAKPFLHHIHFLDSERNPPSRASQGIDLPAVLATLAECDYRHYLSMPLMKGSGDAGTVEAVRYLRSLIAAL